MFKTFLTVFGILWAVAAIGAFVSNGHYSWVAFLLGFPFSAAVVALVVVGIVHWIKTDKPFSKKV